jgi:hypothetical protein
MLLAAFYSSIQTVLSHTSGEVVRCKNVSQWAPSAALHTSYLRPPFCRMHVLCKMWNRCSDPCFDFTQHIRSLAVHLGFHVVPKKKSKGIRSGEQNSHVNGSLLCIHPSGQFTFKQLRDNVSKMNKYIFVFLFLFLLLLLLLLLSCNRAYFPNMSRN